MTSSFSRRSFLGLSAAGAMFGISSCAGFSGGGGGNSDGDRSGGSASLDVSWWGDASRAALYDEALDLFGETHSDVTITSQFADLDPYLERLATTAAAGSLPDVLWMRDTHIGRYAAAGSLLDLSPYLDEVIGTSALGDAGVASGTVGDGVFALPTHYVGQAILTNDDLLAAKGIDPNGLVTWTDLADAATASADGAAGIWGLQDATLDTTHRHLEAFIRQSGGELFTEGGGLGADPALLEEWFEYWKSLRDAGVVPPADTTTEANATGWSGDLLTVGKSTIRLASTNHFKIVQDLTDAKIGLHSVPAAAGSTNDWWFFPPILLSVAAETGSPDAAAALMDFFINDTDAAAITRLNQGAPSSAAVRESLIPLLNEEETAFVDQISIEMEYPSRPFPIRPEGAEQFNSALTRTGEEIAYNQRSVSEAVATLVSEAHGYLPEA
ncbi:MAG: extracellular solute-binding protein [Actinomycetales bacterium]|nr:extracellular solute-binding protein [Actinomycetales bacterium]